MSRFLIEVEHPNEPMSCARAVQVFLATGSHYLTHADWGCMDGEHRAWIIVEVDNKEQARGIVPPAFRAQARIIALNKFTLEQMQAMIGKHQR
jgi:hypothetical protein